MKKIILNIVGRVIILEAGFMLLPLLVSLIYKESCYLSFVNSIIISLIAGALLYFAFLTKNTTLTIRDGFSLAALSWIGMSAFGALPFVISGEIPSFADAFFETVSGFTTTGASILSNVEAVSKGLLFWRSFTHWIGGMGMLVFVMALTKKGPDRSTNILRGEMPGHSVDKILPQARSTAKTLYYIYFVLTGTEIVFLLIGGMPLFDSIVHALGTAGTGGFGIKADSIASYSPYLQWVITIFMLLFGVSFNLFYLILIRRWQAVKSSNELWTYLGIFLISSIVIQINISPMYPNAFESSRLAAFQVASILTTTGYATANFDLWPQLSKAILLILMFIGGCMGSTGGGIKVSRVVVFFQSAKNEIFRTFNPRRVRTVKLNGTSLDEKSERSVLSYLALYTFIFFIVFLVISFEPFGLETNFSAAASCFNNIGPGFAVVGPACNYSQYTDFSKIVLSVAMLMGRLEIYPLLSLFGPRQ